MNIVYGNSTEQYRGPEAATATATVTTTTTTTNSNLACKGGPASTSGVRVTFEKGTVGSGLKWVHNECPYEVLETQAHMKTESPDCTHNITDCIKKCGWWDVEMGAGNWHLNVTTTISASGDSVVVSSPTDEYGCPLYTGHRAPTPTAVRYLYADWPVATLYNNEGFPALPFVLNVTG